MSGSGTGLAGWLRASVKDPDALALVDGARRISYRALWNGADHVARLFDRLCGDRTGPIALIGSNAAEYVFAVLGALATGRPVAEISPKEETSRLADLLSRLDPAVLVTNLDPRPFSGLGTLMLDFEQVADAAFAADCGAPFERPIDPASIALIVFTSGTTSQPKGVQLSHGALSKVTDAILGRIPLSAGDRYALVLPLCHTYGKSVLFTSLRVGATVQLVSNFHNLPEFVAELADSRTTAFAGVPYHAQLLRQRARLDGHDLSALRIFTISGGPMPTTDLLDLSTRLRSTGIYYMYGLTECSTRATILPPEQLAARPGSCGRPLPNTALSIIDESGQPVPPGGSGEVRIASPHVMSGYWNEPEQSARTLRGAWLHTGDLGHLDADGYLYLEGRLNELIKCAGERISALEIEQALLTHPSVSEVAVRAVPNAILGEAVGAWIVSSLALLPEDLIAHCASRLAPHKIPRAWYFVNDLPRTATGKVQKARLPLPH